MASVLTEIKTYCSRCGRQTWWYQELGPKPLCERCWDQDVGGTIITARTGIEPLLLPVELAADKRAYYQAHRVEAAADQRAYYQAHRVEIAADKRAYREAHRVELAAYQRAYREAHRVELAADKRAYYQAHRVEIAADKDHNTILEFQANFMREHTGYSFSKQPHAGRHQLTPLPAPA